MKKLDRFLFALAITGSDLSLLLAGCAVGPNYHRPTTDFPASYKATNETGAWKEGTPLDNVPKGNWWEVFNDIPLNQLESQALVANQEIKAAVARVEQARATARVARSELLPSVNFDRALPVNVSHPTRCRLSVR